MSDACYELFEANIEGARAFSRKILIDIRRISRLKTNWAYLRLLLEIRKNFKIMHDLFEQAMNADPRTIPKHRVPIEEQRKMLEEAMDELKSIANDYRKINQKLMAIMKKWPFARTPYRLVLGQLPEKLFDNIETLCLVIEAVLEDEGEYVTAEELLTSLT